MQIDPKIASQPDEHHFQFQIVLLNPLAMVFVVARGFHLDFVAVLFPIEQVEDECDELPPICHYRRESRQSIVIKTIIFESIPTIFQS